MLAAILCYSGAAFGPRTPPFLVDKLESFPQLLISNEVSGSIPNIQWICSHIFELVDLQRVCQMSCLVTLIYIFYLTLKFGPR